MDANTIEERYFRVNKFFGRMIGVWPDQSKFTKKLSVIVMCFVVTSSLTVQIANVARDYNFENLTDQIPYLLLAGVVGAKHINYNVNADKVKDLLDGIVSDWLTDRPKEELAILKIHSKRAALFSFIYSAALHFASFMFSLVPAAPRVLDILLPLNESRARVLVYPAYYFVDDDRYYYFAIAHEIMGSITITTIYTACDSNLMCFVEHARALMAISGYRFTHAVKEECIYYEGKTHTQKDRAYAKVCRSIDSHKRVIEYIEKIEACHDKALFIIVGMLMLMLSVTLLKVATMEKNFQYATFFVFTVVQVAHLLFLNVMGQLVKNSNSETFDEICDSRWYNCSAKTQLLYLMVLRKCLSPPKLSAGGLVELNLNTFVQIMKASFSYYTVLKPT